MTKGTKKRLVWKVTQAWPNRPFHLKTVLWHISLSITQLWFQRLQIFPETAGDKQRWEEEELGQSALTGSFFSPRFGSKSLRRSDEKNNERRLQMRTSDYVGVIVANHWDDLRCLLGSPSLFQNEKTLQNLLSVCSVETLIRSPQWKKGRFPRQLIQDNWLFLVWAQSRVEILQQQSAPERLHQC